MRIFVVIHHDDYKSSVIERCFKKKQKAERYLNKHHQYEDSFRVIKEVELE